jgi:hypothetical protein
VQDKLDALNKVDQEAHGTTTTTKAKTASQLQAELNKQLSTIAGANTSQLIGQSASAQKALDKQKELDELVAMGKGDSALAQSLRNTIDRNTDIALGDVLTSSDKEMAHQQALEDYFGDTTQSMSELEKQYQDEILAQKKGDRGTTEAQKAKADAAGAGGKTAPPVSLQAICQAIQNTLQKIEPKIPTHVMA